MRYHEIGNHCRLQSLERVVRYPCFGQNLKQPQAHFQGHMNPVGGLWTKPRAPMPNPKSMTKRRAASGLAKADRCDLVARSTQKAGQQDDSSAGPLYRAHHLIRQEPRCAKRSHHGLGHHQDRGPTGVKHTAGPKDCKNAGQK